MTVYEYGMFLTREKMKEERFMCTSCIIFGLMDGVRIRCICQKYGYRNSKKSRNYGNWRKATPIEILLFMLKKNT